MASLTKVRPNRWFPKAVFEGKGRLDFEMSAICGKNMLLGHVFGDNYDEKTGKITPVILANGEEKQVFAEQGKTGKDKRDIVSKAMIISNLELYCLKNTIRDPKPHKTNLLRHQELTAASDSEVVAFDTNEFVQEALLKNGIPCTNGVVLSDLAQGNVYGIKQKREELKQTRELDDAFLFMLNRHGHQKLNILTLQELSAAQKLGSGTGENDLLWVLESQLRGRARDFVKSMVKTCRNHKDGLEQVVKEYLEKYRLEETLEDWKAMNVKKKQTCELVEDKYSVYLHSRRSSYSFHIYLSSKDKWGNIGTPHCAAITMVLMELFVKMGYSHVIASFGDGEVQKPSGGMFASELLLRLPYRSYV